MKYKLVRVLWDDSYSLDEWLHEDDDNWHSNFKVETVGFLIRDKKKFVTVASTLTDGYVCHTMTIPKCAIKKIKKLKG